MISLYFSAIHDRSAGLGLLPILQEILWHLVGSPQRTVNLIIEHLQRAGYDGYELLWQEYIDIDTVSKRF